MEEPHGKIKGKGGRPAKAVRREKQSGIRFTKAEYFIVKGKAAKAGLPFTVYLRQMALHGQVKARLNEDEKLALKQLIGMATNLNQLAKSTHQQGFLSAAIVFEQYRSQFDDLLNRLKNDK